jgi:hypothetical protein
MSKNTISLISIFMFAAMSSSAYILNLYTLSVISGTLAFGHCMWLVLNYNQIPTHEEIAKLAAQKWREAGQPSNRDEEFWLQAEKELYNP